MKIEDPTIATVLKPLGYATGQFAIGTRCFRPITASTSSSATTIT
jgi:hypothetical protein